MSRKVEPSSTFRNDFSFFLATFSAVAGCVGWAMFRATCLAMALRNKSHKKLCCVTAPLALWKNRHLWKSASMQKLSVFFHL